MKSALANRIVFVLALAGAGVAGYLTLAHLHYMELVCGPLRGCDVVASDPRAHGLGIPALSGIPTAAFGLAMYLAVATLSFLRVVVSERAARTAARLQWLLALGGVAVAAWLTWVEGAVIHAWCQWCVASAIITLLIFITLSAAAARRAPEVGTDPVATPGAESAPLGSRPGG